MYSYDELQKIKEELNLIFIDEDEHKETKKFNQKTKINLKCKYPNCEQDMQIEFGTLYKKRYPVCKTHRYTIVSEKVSNTKTEQNVEKYEENKKLLYNLVEELGIQLIKYEDILTGDSNIKFRCKYDGCLEEVEKQFKSIKKNKLVFCKTHHYIIHNEKINSVKREKDKEKYDEYNKILDTYKEKYPDINLHWDRDKIYCQSELKFNCINNRCKKEVVKLFQRIHQGKEKINEIFFGCEECKFYISESLRDDITLLKNTEYYTQLIEYPKQIDYITTNSCLILKWGCKQECINCKKKHVFESSPFYRFFDWKTDCPLCNDINKCDCIGNGFICTICNKYYLDKKKKREGRNICKICDSKSSDDNLEVIFKSKIHNCINICKTRTGNRANMNLDEKFLMDLYNEQKGLCYISKIPLSLKIHSNFRISIERLNENNGYVKDNVKLICLEFQNGQIQWTPQKFDTFCKNYYKNQIVSDKEKEEVKKNYDEAINKKYRPAVERKKPTKKYFNDEKKECLCTKCGTIKNYDFFSDYGIKTGLCKDCNKILNKNNRENTTLRLKLSNLISSSKSGMNKRNNSKWRKDNNITHELTFEELLNIYLQQNGRCFYSNQKLELTGEYMMSLERINTKIGYTKENCCLICIEFNTTDWSIVKSDDDDREGSSGWSKEKIKLVVDNYLKNEINYN